MSHVISGEVTITDLEALRTAVAAMGCAMVQKKTYNWYGQSVGDYPLPKGVTAAQLGKCDFAIQVPGARYEVGVVKQKDGTFTLAYDFYGSTTQEYTGKQQGMHDGQKLLKKFGDKMSLLQQQYNKQVVVKQAKAKGYLVKEKLLPNGAIKLQLVTA